MGMNCLLHDGQKSGQFLLHRQPNLHNFVDLNKILSRVISIFQKAQRAHMPTLRLAPQLTGAEVATRPVTTHCSREYPAPTQDLALLLPWLSPDHVNVSNASLRLSIKKGHMGEVQSNLQGDGHFLSSTL